MGACESMLIRKWCQGPIITGMNGCKAIFMNIPSGLIFLFQLPITLFPFGSLICFSSLFLSHPSFSCLRTLSPLPQGVNWSFQIVFKPRVSQSLSHKASKKTILTVAFLFFKNPSSERLDNPLSTSWHPSSDKITRRTAHPPPLPPVASVFQSFKQCCTNVETATK